MDTKPPCNDYLAWVMLPFHEDGTEISNLLVCVETIFHPIGTPNQQVAIWTSAVT